MSALAWLLYAELGKQWRIASRYPLQPLCGALMLLALFCAVRLGLGWPGLAGPALFEGGDSRVIVASFVCWVMAVGAIGHVGGELEEDIKAGLLEPLFLSRHAPCAILLVRSLGGALVGLPVGFALLAILAAWTGAAVRPGWTALLALALLELSLAGIGLAMAGLVILFKRAAAVAPLLQLGLAVLVARGVATGSDQARLRYPVASALEVYSRAVFGTDLTAAAVGSALAWALAGLCTGAALLACCIRQARRAGTLGHY